jgi:branched-chain amino acid transport system permease protein
MQVLQALVNGITEGTILALAALGLTLVFGISRFPNAAHGDYLTAGAYGAYWAAALLGLSMPLAALAGIAFSMGTGLLFYFFVFRKLAKRSGAVNLIASIGIALFVRHAIIFMAGTEQFSYGLPILRAWRVFGLRIFPMDVLFAGISIAAMGAVHFILSRTEIGRKMRAVSDNPQLARIGGIRSGTVHVVMWMMALSLAGLSGILLGMKTVIDPLMGWDMLLPAFAAAILGGFGSPGGAILGGIIIGTSQELAVLFISETYKVAVAFIVITAVLLIRPWGLMGRREVVR